jgi:hypothetical protein
MSTSDTPRDTPRDDRDTAAVPAGESTSLRHDVVAREKERFGGIKFGSAFFGWLAATGTAAVSRSSPRPVRRSASARTAATPVRRPPTRSRARTPSAGPAPSPCSS